MDNPSPPSKCPFAHTARAEIPPSPPTPPTPTPGPPNLIAFDQHLDPLAFLADLITRYGDVVRYQTCFSPCLLFIHPDHVQTILHRENYRRASLVKMMLGEGLLAIDGPRWRSQRRLMQKEFLPAAVAPLLPVVTHETTRTAQVWQAAANLHLPVDIGAAMTLLTLRIIVQSLFSYELSDEKSHALCQAITQTINDIGNISKTVFGVPVRLTPGSNAAFTHAKKTIDDICYDIIARRKNLPPEQRPQDILTLLIEADTDTGPMTDLQLRDEVVTMLVGGHETTALALSWAWKLLAEHPQIEHTLHTEVDETLAGRAPTRNDLPTLPWSCAIFQEAMRLYPPVWYMARVAAEDDTIHGHPIPKGACVLVSAYFTHRHKDFWPDPERFHPARFLNPSSDNTRRYAYFPFGGRHQCLGMHFANMEGALILAQLAQQFRVRSLQGQTIRPDPGITLRQSPAMQAHLEPRILQSAPQLAVAGSL